VGVLTQKYSTSKAWGLFKKEALIGNQNHPVANIPRVTRLLSIQIDESRELCVI
jgi:hypothetical protein